MTDVITDFDAHYRDHFRIGGVTGEHTAREWAQSCTSGVEVAHRAFGRLVWHGVLGFDLAPAGTPGTMAGWRIEHETPTDFALRVDGPIISGLMIFRVTPGAVTWSTQLHFHGARGRRIWMVAGHAHRAIVPVELRLTRRAFARG